MKHCDQVLALLRKQIPNAEEVEEIRVTAREVARNWVRPTSVGREETNGLIYGLIQSGKTGVLTVTGAMGADEGYGTIIILTSDNDPLYWQTLGRAREAFPGIDIIGKSDFKDPAAFAQRLNAGPCAIVTTKNAGLLTTLIENFKIGRVRGVACLIIDDEADQASLNTRARKADGSRSAINDKIWALRKYFEKNTYLQVTATPQALFLQTPGHDFRPKFTVLSRPGSDYVGGEDFFGDDSNLVREFAIGDITALSFAGQPTPTLKIPTSLRAALDTFMIGATYKRSRDADQNCAFLCHVSTRKSDHQHIVDLLLRYRIELTNDLRERKQSLLSRLQAAYDDLTKTHPGLREVSFGRLLDEIEFFSPGIAVKLVNGETDEDVAVQSPYNLFVGGNKLGRGVTIKNLLVSYYGRNPRVPQADTVLQHARMYGYRRKDIGLLRLFLPNDLHIVFKAINQMERGLRRLIERAPSEEFRGVYLSGGLSATRRNVLAPGSIGIYSGGGIYNPAQIVRDHSIEANTVAIDAKVKVITNRSYREMPLETLRSLLELTVPDQSQSERIWNPRAVAESVGEFGKFRKQHTGYVYVDRGRGGAKNRRETQGILDGAEGREVPDDKVILFLLRTTARKGGEPAWWPQIRFPAGQYGFAFAL